VALIGSATSALSASAGSPAARCNRACSATLAGVSAGSGGDALLQSRDLLLVEGSRLLASAAQGLQPRVEQHGELAGPMQPRHLGALFGGCGIGGTTTRSAAECQPVLGFLERHACGVVGQRLRAFVRRQEAQRQQSGRRVRFEGKARRQRAQRRRVGFDAVGREQQQALFHRIDSRGVGGPVLQRRERCSSVAARERAARVREPVGGRGLLEAARRRAVRAGVPRMRRATRACRPRAARRSA
jgi:hypothetical protein